MKVMGKPTNEAPRCTLPDTDIFKENNDSLRDPGKRLRELFFEQWREDPLKDERSGKEDDCGRRWRQYWFSSSQNRPKSFCGHG
jgi:hypothetical protein